MVEPSPRGASHSSSAVISSSHFQTLTAAHKSSCARVCKRTHLPAGSVPLPFNFLLRL